MAQSQKILPKTSTRRRSSRALLVVVLVVAGIARASAAPPAAATVSAPTAPPVTDFGASSAALPSAGAMSESVSQYVPVSPQRLLDTRSGPAPAAGSSVVVQIGGRAGVPVAGAVAVVVNVTATESGGAGFVTVYPAGTERPDSSNINPERSGQTIANLVTVQLSAGGAIEMYTHASSHLLVDVEGFYQTVAGPVAAGRLVATAAFRLFDSRDGTPFAADESRTFGVFGRSGIPAVGVAAVVLDVTATEAGGAGFVTVFPAGIRRPEASNLNVDHVGQTISNQVIVPLDQLGQFSVYSHASSHIVADVTGWYSSSGATPDGAGLFIAQQPVRALDTRTVGRLKAGQEVVVGSTEARRAVVLNVTLVDAAAPGFVTAFPAGASRPSVSMSNAERTGQTIANHAIVATGDAGLKIFVQSGGHIVVDIEGSFTTATHPVAAVGDAVCGPGLPLTADLCRQAAVSSAIVAARPEAFLALGDLQYNVGALADFQQYYEPTYGRLKSITRPSPGNHEYNTPGATGYYAYFGPSAHGDTGGYYSFDIGDRWHVVSLNSNCDFVGCGEGSAQLAWLRADLATSARPCTLAYWHHPRFSSGEHGDIVAVAPLWDALEAAGADVVLTGHDHDYERLAPTDAMREFVVGTGGYSQRAFLTPLAFSEVRLNTYGYLALDLRDDDYDWRFVTEAGNVVDSGTTACR